MTTEQYIVMAAVPLVVLWPQVSAWGKRLLSAKAAAGSPAGPTFEAAVHDLAGVRLRLTKTALLGDEQKKAIDTLTLALVAGSDQ